MIQSQNLNELQTVTLALPPAFWDALAGVKRTNPEAIMAGGCLRDLYLGRPLRDIDVFVGPRFDWRHLAARNRHWNVNHYDVSADEYHYEGFELDDDGENSPRIRSVYDVHAMLDGEDHCIQVISLSHMPAISDLLHRFDFGFCEIVFDGDRTVVSERFLSEVAKKHAICRFGAGHHRYLAAQSRANRLAEKYPDWRFSPSPSTEP